MSEETQMSAKVAHLQMIQGIINRLAGNSFDIKRWAIMISMGALAISLREGGTLWLSGPAVIGAVIFACLDAYYLRQERLFRNWYNEQAKLPETKFEMKPLVMKPKQRADGYFVVLASKTVLWLHLAAAAPNLGIVIREVWAATSNFAP